MNAADITHLDAIGHTLQRVAHPDTTPEHTKTYGPTAPDFLLEAADTIGARAAERDRKEERSMSRAVRMFNVWRDGIGVNTTGALTERDGWAFMAFLKLSRMQGGDYRRDDYVDGAAYIALAGECVETKTRIPS